MKKVILVSLIVMLSLSTLLYFEQRASVNADTQIIYVPTDYATIQEAINHANESAIIYVRAKTYYEHVIVNKSISLIGEDSVSTIIDGSNTDSVIYVSASNVTIKGFTLRNSGISPYDSGINIDHTGNNTISNNKITSCNDGIGLYSSMGNIISDNIILSNDNDGIGLYSSLGNTIFGNTFTDNYDGIGLYFSLANTISGNTFTDNYNGINLAFYSRSNDVYHNNFDNINQVLCDLRNTWNDVYEGNYWSDYNGNDPNGDGIGDTPYIMNVNNKDEHPLMGTFSEFSITLERQLYHVTTICNSSISNFVYEIGPETGNKIIHFNVTGEAATTGFCRILLPSEFVNYPPILLVDETEIVPTVLDISNATHVYLYFTYLHSNRTITIISSKTLYLYNQLFGEYSQLGQDLLNLNLTYYDLLANYTVFLSNYTQLQNSYQELNNSYQDHILDYAGKMQNIQNLVYIFAATTAIFLVTTIYLSKQSHSTIRAKRKIAEEEQY